MRPKLVNPLWFLSLQLKSFCTSKFSHSTATAFKEQKTPTTVDQAEIDHHSKIKEWWSEDGPMKALHTYNMLRVPFIRDGLLDMKPNAETLTPLEGKTILDVGCGAGILSEPLARLGAKVVGIDASEELIELARHHSSLNTKLLIAKNVPEYICTTVEDHAESFEQTYDGVVASEVIEHVSDKELFVSSCIKALKPNGRIFFTTPTRTKLAEIGVIYFAENILRLVPKGTHRIDKFTTPTELSFLLERNNCHVEIIHGIFYNFVTNKWSWSSSQAFVFALQAVKQHLAFNANEPSLSDQPDVQSST